MCEICTVISVAILSSWNRLLIVGPALLCESGVVSLQMSRTRQPQMRIYPHRAQTGEVHATRARLQQVVAVRNAVQTVPRALRVMASGSVEMLCRGCVDCGTKTGCFCDWCLASSRIPTEEWEEGQRTPLCTACDRRWSCCHFCRGQHWCTPPVRGEEDRSGQDSAQVDGQVMMGQGSYILLCSTGANRVILL